MLVLLLSLLSAPELSPSRLAIMAHLSRLTGDLDQSQELLGRCLEQGEHERCLIEQAELDHERGRDPEAAAGVERYFELYPGGAHAARAEQLLRETTYALPLDRLAQHFGALLHAVGVQVRREDALTRVDLGEAFGRCADMDAEACTNLALALEQHPHHPELEGRMHDPWRLAARVMARGCELGSFDACAHVADTGEFAVQVDGRPELKIVLRELERVCSEHVDGELTPMRRQSCALLARVRADEAAADIAELFESMCVAGDRLGCTSLAEASHADGMLRVEQLCDAGSFDACAERDELRAATKTCATPRGPVTCRRCDCAQIAASVRELERARGDALTAADFEARACDGTQARSICAAMKTTFKLAGRDLRVSHVLGRMPDACRAAPHVCDLAIAAFARAARADSGVTLSTYDYACRRGSREACARVGAMLVRGRVATKNTSKGAALLREACGSTIAWACNELSLRGEREE